LSCGSLVSGNITAAGQTDQYTLEGQANEIVTVTLSSEEGLAGGHGVVYVFAPSGAQIASFAANGQQQVNLPAAGTYVIQVVGWGYISTGKYNLGLECRNPNAPVTAVLGCGALAHGTIAAQAQVNQYTYQGQANEIVTVTLADTAGFASGPAVLYVFAPSGVQIASFAANGQQQVKLPATGTYVIQVVGWGYISTGQYNLGLVCTITATPVFSPAGGTYNSAQL